MQTESGSGRTLNPRIDYDELHFEAQDSNKYRAYSRGKHIGYVGTARINPPSFHQSAESILWGSLEQYRELVAFLEQFGTESKLK